MKKILKQNVGIDVSMDKFDVNLSNLTMGYDTICKGRKIFKNNNDGFLSLIEWLSPLSEEELPLTFTIEFTGVYYENLAYFLRDQGFFVYMVIPSKAKKFQESLSKCSKTDQMDAQVLAKMGLERKMKEWNPISSEFRRLRILTREREQLLNEKQAVKNQLHAVEHSAFPEENTINRYKNRIDFIVSQIEEVEVEVHKLLQSDDVLWDKISIILTIPGVGLITAATVVAETNGFASIGSLKQLISYAGYDVKLNQSGKFRGQTSISKQGNSHIRRVLYLPAQCARKYNPNLEEFYNRINERNTKKMIAGVAVQKKLLCLIYSIWKNDVVYDPNYNSKNRA